MCFRCRVMGGRCLSHSASLLASTRVSFGSSVIRITITSSGSWPQRGGVSDGTKLLLREDSSQAALST